MILLVSSDHLQSSAATTSIAGPEQLGQALMRTTAEQALRHTNDVDGRHKLVVFIDNVLASLLAVAPIKGI